MKAYPFPSKDTWQAPLPEMAQQRTRMNFELEQLREAAEKYTHRDAGTNGRLSLLE